MAEIKLNVTSYDAVSKKFKDGADRSKESYSKIKFSPENCDLYSINKYIEAVTKVRTLIGIYNKVLENDANGLKKVRNEFLKIDETIKNSLKRD